MQQTPHTRRQIHQTIATWRWRRNHCRVAGCEPERWVSAVFVFLISWWRFLWGAGTTAASAPLIGPRTDDVVFFVLLMADRTRSFYISAPCWGHCGNNNNNNKKLTTVWRRGNTEFHIYCHLNNLHVQIQRCVCFELHAFVLLSFLPQWMALWLIYLLLI